MTGQTIKVQCPSCRAQFGASKVHIGRTVKCRKCRRAFQINPLVSKSPAVSWKLWVVPASILLLAFFLWPSGVDDPMGNTEETASVEMRPKAPDRPKPVKKVTPSKPRPKSPPIRQKPSRTVHVDGKPGLTYKLLSNPYKPGGGGPIARAVSDLNPGYFKVLDVRIFHRNPDFPSHPRVWFKIRSYLSGSKVDGWITGKYVRRSELFKEETEALEESYTCIICRGTGIDEGAVCSFCGGKGKNGY